MYTAFDDTNQKFLKFSKKSIKSTNTAYALTSNGSVHSDPLTSSGQGRVLNTPGRAASSPKNKTKFLKKYV